MMVVVVVVVRYDNSYLFCYIPKSVCGSTKFIVEICFNSFHAFILDMVLFNGNATYIR